MWVRAACSRIGWSDGGGFKGFLDGSKVRRRAFGFESLLHFREPPFKSPEPFRVRLVVGVNVSMRLINLTAQLVGC
jgi:hypothetical protein